MEDEVLEEVLGKFRSDFSEIYEIVKKFEIVYGDETYRLEIIKAHRAAGMFYDARCFRLIERPMRLDGIRQDVEFYVLVDFPSVQMPDAGNALAEALRFLKEERK